jgi:hypothetical protein
MGLAQARTVLALSPPGTALLPAAEAVAPAGRVIQLLVRLRVAVGPLGPAATGLLQVAQQVGVDGVGAAPAVGGVVQVAVGQHDAGVEKDGVDGVVAGPVPQPGLAVPAPDVVAAGQMQDLVALHALDLVQALGLDVVRVVGQDRPSTFVGLTGPSHSQPRARVAEK